MVLKCSNIHTLPVIKLSFMTVVTTLYLMWENVRTSLNVTFKYNDLIYKIISDELLDKLLIDQSPIPTWHTQVN